MKKETNAGVFYTFLSYFLWGFFPIYWKSLEAFDPYFLFAFRMVFSSITATIVLIITRNYKNMQMKNKRSLFFIFLASIFISVNWFLFIYAVVNNKILDTALAYYICPMISMLFGIIIYKEKKTILEYIAIIIAGAGIVYKTVFMGSLPLLSLGMAFSFAIYGLLKKQTHYNAVVSIFIEMTIAAVPSLIYMIYFINTSTFTQTPIDWFLLSFAGPMSITPLLIFSKATKMVPLATIGFFQFIVPIMSTITGVFLYKEALDRNGIITFTLIIISVIIYIISIFRNAKKLEIKNA